MNIALRITGEDIGGRTRTYLYKGIPPVTKVDCRQLAACSIIVGGLEQQIRGRTFPTYKIFS